MEDKQDQQQPESKAKPGRKKKESGRSIGAMMREEFQEAINSGQRIFISTLDGKLYPDVLVHEIGASEVKFFSPSETGLSLYSVTLSLDTVCEVARCIFTVAEGDDSDWIDEVWDDV